MSNSSEIFPFAKTSLFIVGLVVYGFRFIYGLREVSFKIESYQLFSDQQAMS